MVGVAGRSKGCHTCLKRRIKCDEKRPCCRRCEQAGYACKGYERKLDIRFHTFPCETNTKVSVDKHNPLPQEMSLIAFQDNIQFSFLFANFVWNHYGSPWLQMSAKGKIDALSFEACQAFALSVFGQNHHLVDLEIEGAIHYDRAVSVLSSQLPKVGAPGSEALLIPIMIFLMQSSSRADVQASAYHVQALMKLILICGPKRFATEPLRFAFESCRATLITVSLLTKSRTFLEDLVWRTEPWSYCGNFYKTAQNELVDIFAFVPGFVHDQMLVEQSGQESKRLDLIHRVEGQLSEAYDWRLRWEERNAGTIYEVEPETVHTHRHLTNFRPFQKVLLFSSWTRASEISLYNAVVLCILSIFWSLKPRALVSAPNAPSKSVLILPNEIHSLDQLAIEICRIFEFQLAMVKQSQESTLFWLLPLGLAGRVLEDDMIMSTWIKDMLDLSPITSGYGTGTNNYGFGAYKFPKMHRMSTPCSTKLAGD